MARRAAAMCHRLVSTAAMKRGGRSYSDQVPVDLSKSPFGMISTFGDWALTHTAMTTPGMDYKHWEVTMDTHTNQQLVDYFVKTLAQVVGSEEEAKKRIYKVRFKPGRPLFGCQIDWDTSSQLQDMPGVISVRPDYYEDRKNKDYGGELFVNGEIVQRSPK